ncbi:MAG: hypothetical protein QW803_09180 [Candidatus Methanomethylicia archaeon]
MYGFVSCSIFTSLIFIKKIRALYGSNIIVLSDGTHYYSHVEY